MDRLKLFFSKSRWFGESNSPQPEFNRQEWIDVAKLQQLQYSITVKDWKKFDCVTEQSQIKTTIGLSLFEHVNAEQTVGTEQFDIVSYYKLYDDKTQSIINKIFNLIVENEVENDIYLGHTILFCLTDKCEQFVYSLLRTRKNNGDVVFFDNFGRYYKSWSYFETTNKLPVCVYIVPVDGVYSSNNNIVEKRNESSNYDTVSNYLSVGGLGGLVGSFFVPSILIPSLIVSTVTGVANPMKHLIDRYRHKQTINPLTNRESLWQYSLLSGSVLSGASAVSFRYFAQLESAIGSRATNIVKILTCGTVVVDGSIAAKGLYSTLRKIYSGEKLSKWDLLDLSLNIFLICGLTIQIREMNKLMRMNKAGSAKLSRTAKRRLQRKRAKARANGVPIESVTLNKPNGNILSNEIEYRRLLQFSFDLCSRGITLLPHGDIVVDACSRIMILVQKYLSHKISLSELIIDITSPLKVIYSALRTDVENIIQQFSRYAPNIFNSNVRSNDPFLLTVMNETDNAEVIVDNLFNDANLRGLDANEQDGTMEANYDNTEEETETEAGSSSSLEINYIDYHYRYHNSLIDAIHRSYILPSRNVPLSQSLRCYNSYLNTKASRFLETTVAKYHRAVELNKRIYDDELASVIVSKTLGKFVDGEFYPTKEFIEEEIDSVLPEENQNSDKHFEDAFNLIGERIIISCNNCFECEKFGLESIIEIIKYTVDNLIEQCLLSYNEKHEIVHQVHEVNVNIVGDKKAKDMLGAIGLSLDESDIFKAAFDEVNMEQFETSLHKKFTSESSDKNNFVEPSPPSEPNGADDNVPSNLYEMIGKIVQQLSNKLLEIQPSADETEELHKKIFVFVVKSISEAFKSDVEKKERLNVEDMKIMDQCDRLLMNNLRIMKDVKHRYLVEKYKWFTSEDKIEQLVSEFSDFTYTREFKHPRIYGSFIDSDSIIIYEVTCADNLTDEGYIDVARTEFNLEIDSSRAAVTRLDNKVVIIYGDKIIHFLHGESSEGSTILTLIDADKNDNLL